MSEDRLKEYRKKRNFKKTREPGGGKKDRGKKPVFVIQKHYARNLHYDFRLEVEGALASWAVPKGISTDKKDKRLAVRTEDHPFSYKNFEGIIPEGEYGAGTVLVWDAGTYENITEKDGEIRDVSESIEKGHLLIKLNGKKIKGGYALTRMRKGKSEQWLLVKMDDDFADARRNPLKTEPESVISGKKIEEIAKENEEK